jgi:thiamine transport system substrate-binding protein
MFKRKLGVWLLALGGVVLGSALAPASAQTLRVLTHSSFSLSEELVAAFTEETGIEVVFLSGGDAGETVNRAILTRANPLADVLFGVDNSLIARAAQAGIFEPYASPLLERVPERYRFSELVTPIDVGYVNFNYDVAWFEAEGLEPPTSLGALTDPAYEGLTVVQNPASSSPGLAFMLTTIAKFGDGWLEYWAALRDNGLQVTDGWTDAYYTAFTRYGGDRPVVLSYASSPAAEVVFAEEALDAAPTANVFCEGCVYEQIEAAGILAGSDNVEAAQTFIDWLLSREVQEDIPLNMFVYPVSEAAEVPEVFLEHGGLPEPEHLATIDADEVEANLSAWLDAWTRVVQQGQDPEAVR